MGAEYGIGELARRTGCKVQTIRYYEQIGLMPPAPRTGGNQRRYGERDATRLAFIRHGRELGFSLDQIRSLLELSDRPDLPCEDADEIARANLEAVERRIRSLQSLKRELERMIRECGGGRVADCRILEVVSDHSQCLNPRHDASGSLASTGTPAGG